MFQLASLLSLVLIVSSFPGGIAGPTCAKSHYQAVDCVQRCSSKWGWTGHLIGTDRWGSVMRTGDNSAAAMQAQVVNACGQTASTGSTSGSISGPAMNVPASPTSDSVTSSTKNVVPSVSVSSSSSSSASISSSTVISSSSVSTNLNPTLSGTFAGEPIASSSEAANFAPPAASTARAAKPSSTKAPSPPSPPKKTTTQAPTTTASPSPTPQPQDPSNGGTSSSDIAAYLAGHNTVRAQHGAAALTWSDDLASKAQQWANGCVFEHSGGSLGPFGENLAAGTGSYSIANAIKGWTDEVSEYNPSNPTPSHFTQVVWKGTTQVGCAVQTCNGIFDASFGPAKYYVCEYSAQGNVIGRFATNVQA